MRNTSQGQVNDTKAFFSKNCNTVIGEQKPVPPVSLATLRLSVLNWF